MQRLAHLLVVLAAASACAGTSGPATHHAPRAHRAYTSTTSARHDAPQRGAQASLVGHMRGTEGGYTSLIVATDASRTVAPGATHALITLAGIGQLQVSCTRAPRGRFRLTPFARGEGPPTVTMTHTDTRGVTSLPAYTRDLLMRIPPSEAHRQRVEMWRIEGGGEAFQFAATITDLLTPTATRCDLLAQATVVTHGPFYRYAHAAP